MVIASLAPGEVSSIFVDEENQSMEINVDPSQLAQIIGRNGQNIRLQPSFPDGHSTLINQLSLTALILKMHW